MNLINHLASKEVLSVEDPLEIQAVGSLVIPRDYDNQNWEWSGSYLFEYPEGYMFNFVTGFRVQAHLPTHVKNGLSFHIEVKCSDPYSVQTELLLFERPGLTGTIHSVSGSSLGQSSERARKRCGQNEEAQVIFERGTQSSWPDATTIVRCLPIEAL
ncbi:MAG TPA: hypothetical protein VM432_02715 [Bdellovibrionales bacterium]|nr:hypothetical protein [Bdellovibrionales bacterium]